MATVYIKPGTGSGSGTLAAPYFYSELGTAETAAGVGGTILFTDGTYTISNGQTWDSFLTYESLNIGGAILDCTVGSVGDPAIAFTVGANSSANPWAIKKFKFIDARFRLLTGNTGVINTFSQNIIVSSKAIKYSDVGVMDSYAAGSGSITFTDNSISQIMADVASNGVISRYINTYTFERNTWYISIAGSGAKTLGGSLPNPMKNNIWSSDNASSMPSGLGLDGKSSNSCFFQINTDNTASGTNINGDPLFVDTTTGDLRLRPSSPCINAGTAS